MSYATDTELLAYAAAREITLAGSPDTLLTKALDWLDLQPFSGAKTDPEQALEFPRNGETVVPTNIKTAQMVAAVLVDTGEDLMAPLSQRVLSESVAGAVSVTYSDTGRQSTYYPQLAYLLRPYLGSTGANIFEVRRG
jgi:hypothetical protein